MSLRLLVSLLLVTMTATAGVVFDNSPNPANPAIFNIEAFPINSGVSVSNSFTLTSDSTLYGVNFWAWLLPADSVTTVDWAIGTGIFLSDFGSATANVNNVSLGANVFGQNIDMASFSLPSIFLTAGTYYLTLANAVSSLSSSVLWDESDGAGVVAALNDPSLTPATQYLTGYCAVPGNCSVLASSPYSESFQILGTPEPGTWVLFASGIALAAALRRKMIRRW